MPIVAASPVNYLPIASTMVAAVFAAVLWRHYQRSASRYLLFWTIGVGVYGVGTFTEALTTLFGWHEWLFRAWYISGALLGGVLLAQGTVYLLMSRSKADRLTVGLAMYLVLASTFVVSTPILSDLVDGDKLDGDVIGWQWVRLFSPLVNLYAVAFLVGGASWSAWRYHRRSDRPRSRVVGNALIAGGALLPGIGGAFARFGMVEVLYITELAGLLLIWSGYRVIAGDRVLSIFAAQRAAVTD